MKHGPVSWRVITPPAAEPVSVVLAKANCRVTHTHEDALFALWIEAARRHAEAVLGRAIITQTIAAKFDTWDTILRLPRPRLQLVDSVTYLDPDGVEQTASADLYDVDIDSEPGRVLLTPGEAWPDILAAPQAVTVTYTAGYGDSGDDVPGNIREAILMAVGAWNENRENIVAPGAVELPFAVRQQLMHDRVYIE